MIFKWNWGKSVIFALAAATFCGCINVEYVGQSFPPLPENSAVTIYSPGEPAPAGKYQAIGRFSVVAPSGWNMEDVREKLTELALEKGADAVSVVESKRIQVGVNAPDYGVSEKPNWNRDPRNAGGEFIYSNSFGERVSVRKPKPVYELQVKGLLLATVERYKSMEKLYKAGREKLESSKPKAPAAVQTPEKAPEKIPEAAAAAAEPLKQEQKPAKADPKPLKIDLGGERSGVTL